LSGFDVLMTAVNETHRFRPQPPSNTVWSTVILSGICPAVWSWLICVTN